MKAIKTFVYDTVIGGLVFMIPLFIVMLVLQKVWLFFKDLGKNVARYFGIENIAGAASASILSVFMVVFVCFAFGLVARWSYAVGVRDAMENLLKRYLPMYDYYKATVEQKLKLAEEAAPRPAVLVRLGDVWRPAVLIEEHPGGEHVVFVPNAPNTTEGATLLVADRDLRPSHLNEKTLVDVLLKRGEGLTPPPVA